MCYLALIPVALSVFAGMKQGQAQQQQANAAAATQRQNALFANQAADDATQRGAYDADLQRIKTAQSVGTQRTAGAANGGDINSGSNAQLQEDTAALGELDALTIQNNAAREAYGYKVQALTGNQNANQLEANGATSAKNSILGGVINGAASYFVGGNSFGSMFGSGQGLGTKAALSNTATSYGYSANALA